MQLADVLNRNEQMKEKWTWVGLRGGRCRKKAARYDKFNKSIAATVTHLYGARYIFTIYNFLYGNYIDWIVLPIYDESVLLLADACNQQSTHPIVTNISILIVSLLLIQYFHAHRANISY